MACWDALMKLHDDFFCFHGSSHRVEWMQASPAVANARGLAKRITLQPTYLGVQEHRNLSQNIQPALSLAAPAVYPSRALIFTTSAL